MTQTDATGTTQGPVGAWIRAGVGAWIFRILLVIAAALMAYSWLQPWWSADVAIFKGTDDLVLHPWGIETIRQVRAAADPDLYAMPWFFAPFTWTYFVVAMLALAASLFVPWTISLGRIKLPLAAVLIAVVGLSYLITVGLAYGIGEMRAAAVDTSFIGKSQFTDPMSSRKIKMVSDLRDGYWYALYAGVALFFLALVRGLFIRKPKA
ncbi:MAG: hypothetical protein ACOH2N_02525 [Devosia sp.]